MTVYCAAKPIAPGDDDLSVEIIEKLRRRLDARDQQMIARAGAGDVEQVALGVVDLLQIGVVADRLDALLQAG